MSVEDQILGNWKLESSENFEELMKALGVGYVTRKIGNTTKPNVKLEKNGDEWTFSTTSTFKSSVLKFKLNEQFDEETMDGRKVKTTFAIQDGKFVQTQRDKDNNVVCTMEREIRDGDLVTVARAGDVVSTRVYKRDE